MKSGRNNDAIFEKLAMVFRQMDQKIDTWVRHFIEELDNQYK